MNEMKLFNEKEIRTVWNEDEQQWYFSVVDVVGVLSESSIPRNYWSDLKRKLLSEGSELHEKIVQLKMLANDGKLRETDALNTDGILRLVQSVPSKKAEPFKLWLAKVGRERLEEIVDPGRALERVRDTYRQKGYPEDWINTRIQTIKARKELTDEWKERGVDNSRDYGILTAEISKAAFGMTPSEYKSYKAINNPLANVRDHMNNLELIFTMLSEEATKNITKETDAQGFNENKTAAKLGGDAAGAARKSFEDKTGKKVSTKDNYLELENARKDLLKKK